MRGLVVNRRPAGPANLYSLENHVVVLQLENRFLLPVMFVIAQKIILANLVPVTGTGIVNARVWAVVPVQLWGARFQLPLFYLMAFG